MQNIIKIFITILFAIISMAGTMASDKNNFLSTDTIKSLSPDEAKIGNQIWMTRNLDTEMFRNGDIIPHAETLEDWKRAGREAQPAWCYYDNDPANEEKYGKLYNWYAVTDPRGLAPQGWRIPSVDDWSELTDYLGTGAGNKIKSKEGWFREKNNSNSTGFSALPGGFRDFIGDFLGIESFGYWWTSSEESKDFSWAKYARYNLEYVYSDNGNKENGLSVRCIKN
jgi:uncharacterized protein (TIGR02145 family)